jgi:hypothetical protein
VHFEVDANVCISLIPLAEVACIGLRSHTQAKWLRSLSELGLEVRGAVPIVDLLCHACACRDVASLFRQLLWYIAHHIEDVMFKSVSHDPPSKLALRCTKVDLLNLLWSNNQLDYQLLRYMVAGMRETEGQLRLSLAFDKANVGGLSLGNGVLALPNDIAFIVAPQVGWSIALAAIAQGPGELELIRSVWLTKLHRQLPQVVYTGSSCFQVYTTCLRVVYTCFVCVFGIHHLGVAFCVVCTGFHRAKGSSQVVSLALKAKLARRRALFR